MTGLTVVPCTEAHAHALAPNLRAADIREVKALSGRDAGDVLKASVGRADLCQAVIYGETVIAIFGVGSTKTPRVGKVWLLASDDLYTPRIKTQFLRAHKTWVPRLMEGRDVLHNHVHVSNQASIRWLKWMGYELLKIHWEFGVGKEAFIHFAKFRDGCREQWCLDGPLF